MNTECGRTLYSWVYILKLLRRLHTTFNAFCCSCFPRPHASLCSHPICNAHLYMDTIAVCYRSSCHIMLFKWERNNLMFKFSRIVLHLTSNHENISWDANFSEHLYICVAYKDLHKVHTLVHQTDPHLWVSRILLRPSSQQGKGTFILIYSKRWFSFNSLHIHKRVSHPRSRFSFQL